MKTERNRELRYVNSFLADCAVSGDLLTKGLRFAPICSVNYGGAGIAFVLYKLGCDHADPNLLSLAGIWINQTIRSMDEPEAFYNPDLIGWNLTEKGLAKTSLYHRPSGVRWVEAFIAHANSSRRICRKAVARFLTESRVLEGSCELTAGKGGILLGCALLMDALKAPSDSDLRERLRVRGEEIYREMALEVYRDCRITSKGSVERLGIAHGTAGTLYALLFWHHISGSKIRPELTLALDRLAKFGRKVGSGVRWPIFRGRRGYWSSWCNGSAGFVFLWTLAAHMLSDRRYLEMARAAANYTWTNPDAHPSLCCGAAGHAYAFLNLYRATNESLWLERAKRTATLAMEMGGDSLFIGRAGVVALLSDLDRPEGSWMPCFEAAP